MEEESKAGDVNAVEGMQGGGGELVNKVAEPGTMPNAPVVTEPVVDKAAFLDLDVIENQLRTNIEAVIAEFVNNERSQKDAMVKVNAAISLSTETLLRQLD